jgi:Fic family protein
MDALLASIRAKKAQLDRLRPLSEAALRHLRKYYDVELTYTSNAIEGNTLTHRETAEVIETASPSAASRSRIIWKRSTTTTRCSGCTISRRSPRR